MTPKRKGFDRQSRARKGFLPPECNCLRGGIADAHRHWFCYTTCLCFYYPLPLSNLVSVRCNRLLSKVRISRQAPTMLPWQAEANLHKSKVDGDCVRVTNRRQSDSEDRSKPSRIATPPGRHPIRQAPQLFKLLACNVKTFLLGDQKGEVLFCEREPPPLSVPCAAQGT